MKQINMLSQDFYHIPQYNLLILGVVCKKIYFISVCEHHFEYSLNNNMK